MSTAALRDMTKQAIARTKDQYTAILLNDRESTGEKVHDQIGFLRGLQTASDILDQEYAEMHR
jgi:hypothetical protein